jgi:hypothetical protein
MCDLFLKLWHWVSESESHVTTDSQPASLSWNKAPIWGLDQIFIIVWQLWVCWFGAPSKTRGRFCRLQLQLALASAVIFWSESRRTRGHILLSQIWDFPFRHLLRLAGSRWRYSNPPPHGFVTLKYCILFLCCFLRNRPTQIWCNYVYICIVTVQPLLCNRRINKRTFPCNGQGIVGL